jgi:hypothetical protein
MALIGCASVLTALNRAYEAKGRLDAKALNAVTID